MAWDIQTARTIAAVGTTPADRVVQAALDAVLSYVENKLQRGLFFRRVTEVRYCVDSRRIQLSRWPIRRVHSPACRIVHKRNGWIVPASFGTDRLSIDYEGGFVTLPSDLEMALWEAFQTYWAGIDQTTGLPSAAGGGSTVVAGSGDISKLVLPGGGSVTWDVGSTVSGGGSGAQGSGDQAYWGWLVPWASVLDPYRSLYA